jgi:triphosphatase
VFATELVPPVRAEVPDQPGWETLSDAAERARAEAHRRVCAVIRSPRRTASLLRLLRWFEGRGWRQEGCEDPGPPLGMAIGKAAPPLLDRRHRQLRRRARHFRELSVHQRHRLRIAAKKLRYTIEVLGGLYGSEARAYVQRLKRVQDELGHANDVRVAYSLVIELGRSAPDLAPFAEAGAELLARHQQILARREKKIRRRLRRLKETRPFWRGSVGEAEPGHTTAQALCDWPGRSAASSRQSGESGSIPVPTRRGLGMPGPARRR